MAFYPRDFIETEEGWVFAVVDGEPECGRILCFLRYIREEGRLRKLGTAAAGDFLAAQAPELRFFSPRAQAWLHGVPRAKIRRHHRPRERIAALLEQSGTDIKEQQVRALLRLFAAGGVDARHFGITGSLLIGAQRADSDLDLVIYGRDQFFRAREVLRQALSQGILEPLSHADWRESYARRGCELSLEDYIWHERRKFNKGMIAGTKFDLTLVDDGLPLEPGPAEKLGAVGVVAKVVDARFAFDHPGIYRLDHPEIGSALSFTQTYAGQAWEGEQVEIAGFLEKTPSGRYRVVVGSSREAEGEFIRVLRKATESR